MSEPGKGYFIYGHLFIYEGIGYNMYTVHLGSLGMIHNFQWIAGSVSLDTKKAEPLLTLPEYLVDVPLYFGKTT
jgi:hypothetical protein